MMERFARVRLLDAPFFLDKEYDYCVPIALHDEVRVGSVVTVPFGTGNRHRMALIVAMPDSVADRESIKTMHGATVESTVLSPEILGLAEFLREQTLCTTGEAVRTMVPAGALAGLSEYYRQGERELPDPSRLTVLEVAVWRYVAENGEVSLKALQTNFGKDLTDSLAHLCRMKLLQKLMLVKGTMAQKQQLYYARIKDAVDSGRRALTAGQTAILALLENGEMSAEELASRGYTRARMRTLVERGLVLERTERVWRTPAVENGAGGGNVVLTDEQQAALDRIKVLARDGAPHGILLHGVTGSGKTSVMLHAIDDMLSRGRGVIVLLPEIALTPQSLAIFCGRYGDRVAVVHSALSAGERMDAYHRIEAGLATVVVGTRSAVFSPVKNLGLIVMDEEHEHTYKSDKNPKYHARDVARWRCAYNKALLLLCSATPSIESYRRATEGRYELLKLTHRHEGATLPTVTVADMRGEVAGGNTSPMGRELSAALTENAERGDQSILFLNRRGYNHVVSCRACGEAIRCPACSISLTYHTKTRDYSEGELVCHICGRRQKMPAKCPTCGSPHLARQGYGTQRVEEELQKLMPHARVLRMDTDTTTSRFSYGELLGKFRRREADVLLGTQMVTKGHDFPDVTLVGVLMADASLYLDDYRAAERTFSMLTQVIGRAGRADKAGHAVIQTNNPDHDVIRLACRQDYEAFYRREIELRRLLVFPPFCDVAVLTLSHANERLVMESARQLAETLKELLSGDFADVKTVVFGPFEAPVYKAEGRYRMRMVVKCRLNRRSRALFAALLCQFGKEGNRAPLLSIDLNPSTL